MVFQQSLLSQSANVNKKDISLIPLTQYLCNPIGSVLCNISICW